MKTLLSVWKHIILPKDGCGYAVGCTSRMQCQNTNYFTWTRKHSSRIRTARLPTVNASVSTRGFPCTVRSKLSKFDHVCVCVCVLGEGSLYSEAQCIMGNGHMGPAVNRHTNGSLVFPQLHWRGVKKKRKPNKNQLEVFCLSESTLILQNAKMSPCNLDLSVICRCHWCHILHPLLDKVFEIKKSTFVNTYSLKFGKGREDRSGSRVPRSRGTNVQFCQNFQKNCMKLRKFWAVGGAYVGGTP